MAIISSKQQMYELYQLGAFGNKLGTWPNIDSWKESNYPGQIVLRYAGTGGLQGGFTKYDVAPDEVDSVVREWKLRGADHNLIKVNELAPDERLRLQGEAFWNIYGLELRVSTEKARMRDAMTRSYTVTGLRARALLEVNLSPSSLADLEALFELYPDSIIEFSAYEGDVGEIPGRNTFIWEVRNY